MPYILLKKMHVNCKYKYIKYFFPNPQEKTNDFDKRIAPLYVGKSVITIVPGRAT